MDQGTSNTDVSITPKDQVRVPRGLLVVFALVTQAVGLAPIAFFLDYPQLLLYSSILAGLATLFLWLRKVERFAVARPRPAEVMLAQADEVFASAFFGLVSLFFYAVAYWVSRLYVFLVPGKSSRGGPSSVGFYTAVVFIAIFAVVMGETIVATARQLYPSEAVKQSPYRVLLARRGNTANLIYVAILVLLAGSIVCYALLGASMWWPYCVIQLLLVLVSTAALPPTIPSSESESRAGTTKQLETLFQQLGFLTEKLQKTGNEGVDPFLADVDFTATKAGRRFLVQIAVGHTPSTVSRTISALRTAAFVLDQERQRHAPPQILMLAPDPHETEAVLVLLGDTAPEEAILELARRELVRVMPLTNGELERIGDPELMNRLSRLLEEPVEAAAQRFTTTNG